METAALDPESVASLVLNLHTPEQSPEAIQALDAQLQAIQNNYPTTTRLFLARKLSKHPEGIVRFYSALLFNAVAKTPAGKHGLEAEYLDLVVSATQHARPHVEIRKLCDAVATLFCSTGSWTACFNELLVRLELVNAANALPTALLAADALTETTGRLNADEPRNHATLLAFAENAKSIIPVLVAADGYAGLESPLSILRQVLVHPAVLARKQDLADDIVRIQGRVLKLAEDKITCDVAGVCEVLLEEYETAEFWPHIFQYAADSNTGALSLILQHRQHRSMNDDILTGAQQLVLTVTYHGMHNGDLFKEGHHAEWLQILEALITEFGQEDMHFSFKLLDFWTEFIDSISSEVISHYTEHFQHAILEAMFRFLPWLADSQDDGQIRDEVGEVVKAVYLCFVRVPPCDRFKPLGLRHEIDVARGTEPNLVLSLLTDKQTILDRGLEVDVRLAAMIAVAEFASKREANDVAIVEILKLPMWSQEGTTGLAIRFVEAYSAYFTRDQSALPEVLQYLIRIVQGATRCAVGQAGTGMDAAHAGGESKVAAQALSSICRTCSNQLTPHASMLLDEYIAISSTSETTASINGLEIQGVLLEAFAAVAYAADFQAFSDVSAHAGGVPSLVHTSRVIDIVEHQVAACQSRNNVQKVESQVSEGIWLLDVLQKIGQSMSIESINLDDDEPSVAIDRQAAQLQPRLTGLISQILCMPGVADSEIALRLLCDLFVLRLQHAVPAFFGFSAALHLEVLRVCVSKHLALDHAFETFSRIIMSRRNTRDDGVNLVVGETVAFVQSIVSDDLDTIVNVLKLLTACLNGYSDIVRINSPTLVSATDLITLADPLPKEWACRLWIALLSTGEPGLEQYLQKLVWNVCSQVGGSASRGDLGILAELTAKLVLKTDRKLFEEVFTTAKGLPGWERFVAQIFMLRGKVTETRRVTIQFWEQCTKGPDQTIEDDSDEEIIVLDWSQS